MEGHIGRKKDKLRNGRRNEKREQGEEWSMKEGKDGGREE